MKKKNKTIKQTKSTKTIIQGIFSEIIKYLKLHIERLQCIPDNIDPPKKKYLDIF